MRFKSSPSSEGGSQKYLKINPGEFALVVFRGDPYEFSGKWENGKFTKSSSGSFRFAINAIVNENGMYVAKIWEGGPTLYNQLKDLHTEYPLDETIVKVSRTGTGMETTYNLIPAKQQMNDIVRTQIKAVPLNVLGEEKEKFDSNDSMPTFTGNEEIPF